MPKPHEPTAAQPAHQTRAISAAESLNRGPTPNSSPPNSQLMGRPFDEPTLFRAAQAYEQSTQWPTRRPPLDPA